MGLSLSLKRTIMPLASEVSVAEYKVWQLAKIYREEFIKHDPRVFKLSKVKESKWWNFFSRCIDYFGSREEWDTRLFIKSLFEKYGKVYPYDLIKRKNWEDYLDYKNSRIETETIQDILTAMLNDYKKMKKLMVERNIENYFDFFTNNYCIEMIERGTFDKLLFYFMKSSNYEYNEKIVLRKMIVCRNRAALAKLKELFGEELYLDDVKLFISKAGN